MGMEGVSLRIAEAGQSRTGVEVAKGVAEGVAEAVTEGVAAGVAVSVGDRVTGSGVGVCESKGVISAAAASEGVEEGKNKPGSDTGAKAPTGRNSGDLDKTFMFSMPYALATDRTAIAKNTNNRTMQRHNHIALREKITSEIWVRTDSIQQE